MNYFIFLLIKGIIFWRISECAFTWEITYHTGNQHGYTWEEADEICKADGQLLAVVDSEEKWQKVKYTITGGDRYTAEADVYIGLIFDQSINNFTWSAGNTATWAKWFQNEPYNTNTRGCVRLSVYAQYYFRTTDCSYRHNFVCSYEVYVPEQDTETTTTKQPVTASSGVKTDMVVGLSVGFGIFLGVGIFICFLCRCCCNFTEKKYDLDTAPRKIKPTRAQAMAQYEIFMNQTEGVDYSRAKSSAMASFNHNQIDEDVFGFATPLGSVDEAAPSRMTHYNKSDDVSMNDAPSPSTVKSVNYMNFM